MVLWEIDLLGTPGVVVRQLNDAKGPAPVDPSFARWVVFAMEVVTAAPKSVEVGVHIRCVIDPDGTPCVSAAISQKAF